MVMLLILMWRMILAISFHLLIVAVVLAAPVFVSPGRGEFSFSKFQLFLYLMRFHLIISEGNDTAHLPPASLGSDRNSISGLTGFA